MKKIISLLLALLLLPVVGCKKKDSHSASFFLMDTTVTVTLYTTDEAQAAAALADCRTLLSELDTLWSIHSPTGDIGRLNSAPTTAFDLDPRTTALLQQAQEIFQQTGGAFDISLLPLSELWKTCADEDRLPSAPELTHALTHRGTDRLKITETTVEKPTDTRVDLGGIGKGAAISLLLDQLTSSGIPGGLISFGSNVAVFGEKPNAAPFRVALRDPKDAGGTVGEVTLAPGEILSVSGDYERYHTIGGKQYHHILDPATGYPADRGLSSVTVVCRNGALADALSTALFVMGEEAAQAFYRTGVYAFEAIFISHDGSITATPGMTAFKQY